MPTPNAHLVQSHLFLSSLCIGLDIFWLRFKDFQLLSNQHLVFGKLFVVAAEGKWNASSSRRQCRYIRGVLLLRLSRLATSSNHRRMLLLGMMRMWVVWLTTKGCCLRHHGVHTHIHHSVTWHGILAKKHPWRTVRHHMHLHLSSHHHSWHTWIGWYLLLLLLLLWRFATILIPSPAWSCIFRR